MPLTERTDELKRLIQAFESEAGKFYPLTLSLLYVTQDAPSVNRPIPKPNHGIMLWQYYGAIHGDTGAAELAISDLRSHRVRQRPARRQTGTPGRTPA